MEYRYDAVVLRKKETGETDRIYTFYTKEAGKISAIAKGIRKPEAKLSGQLENFTRADVTVVRTRGIGKVAGAVSEETYPHVRGEFEVMKRLLEDIAFFDRAIEWEEPDQRLFDLLIEYLRSIDRSCGDAGAEKRLLASLAFRYQVVDHLGYHIDTEHSAGNGEKIDPSKKLFFSPQAGGVIAEGEQGLSPDAFPISLNTMKLFRLCSRHKLASILKVAVSEKDVRSSIAVLNRFLKWNQ